MNDDQKIDQNQNAASGVSVPIQSQTQNVGSPHKEYQPVGTPLSENIKPSEPRPQVSQELIEIGVQAKSDDFNLTLENRKAGMEHTGASTPVSTYPSGIVQLSTTSKQTKKKIKKTKPTDSLRGLLLEILKSIQRMGLKDQKV